MNLWGICKSFSAFRSSNSAGEWNVTALCTSQSSPTESHLYSAEASSPTCQAESTLKSNPYDVPAAALACRGMKAGSRELMCLTAANTSELHSHSTFHWWQRWEEEMCFFPRLRKALCLFFPWRWRKSHPRWTSYAMCLSYPDCTVSVFHFKGGPQTFHSSHSSWIAEFSALCPSCRPPV